MRSSHKLAIALVAGVALGGAVIQGLHAQSAPPVYVVVNIDAVTDPEGFKALPAKSGPRRWLLSAASTSYVLRKSPHSMEVRPSGLLSSRLTARRKQKPGRLQQARKRLTRSGAKRRSRANSLSRVCND